MTKKQLDKWERASRVARVVMGKGVVRGTRGSPRFEYYKADEDPLAWWCLTELLHDFK